MMWWNSGSGWGTWFGMGLLMVVIWGLVVTAVVLAVRAVRSRRDLGLLRPGAADAGEVLDQRFARGELSEEEYRHRRDLLHTP